MSTSIALLCEGVSDPPTVRALADRVIVASTWIGTDAENIDTHRHYRGFRPDEGFMTWTQIDDLAKQYDVKLRGKFEGLPLHGDGRNTRKALVLLAFHAPVDVPVEAIIIFRDGDREYEARKEAITKVRDAESPNMPVVVGIANRMSECWILNGFDPTDEERERFDAERVRLTFDPRMCAHDLTADTEHEARSPKRVLRALSNNDSEREHACLSRTSFDLLRARGAKTGLAEFLDELESRLPQAFGEHPRPRAGR